VHVLLESAFGDVHDRRSERFVHMVLAANLADRAALGSTCVFDTGHRPALVFPPVELQARHAVRSLEFFRLSELRDAVDRPVEPGPWGRPDP
jgi:hypothetical protein